MSTYLHLCIPFYRQILPQLLQAQTVGFIAAQDRLDNVRREAGQAELAGPRGHGYVAVAAAGKCWFV